MNTKRLVLLSSQMRAVCSRASSRFVVRFSEISVRSEWILMSVLSECFALRFNLAMENQRKQQSASVNMNFWIEQCDYHNRANSGMS